MRQHNVRKKHGCREVQAHATRATYNRGENSKTTKGGTRATYFSFLFVNICLALLPSASFFFPLPPFSALFAAR